MRDDAAIPGIIAGLERAPVSVAVLACPSSSPPCPFPPPPLPTLSPFVPGRAGQKSLGRRQVDASRANMLKYRSLSTTAAQPVRRPGRSRFIWKSLLFPRHRPSCIAGMSLRHALRGTMDLAALQRRWYATGRTRYPTTRLDSAKNPRDDVAADHNKCENNRTSLRAFYRHGQQQGERKRERGGGREGEGGMSAVPECIIRMRALIYSSNYGGSANKRGAISAGIGLPGINHRKSAVKS